MIRPGNIFIALCTYAVGIALAQISAEPFPILADLIAFAFAIAFGNVLNDLLDIEIDRVSHPERPLPAGKVSVFAAKIFTAACALGTLLPAALPNFRAIEHLGFYAALLLFLALYDFWLKKIPLIKNVSVALLCTTPLLRLLPFESATVEPLYAAAAFAFPLTLSREIFKDLEDVEGDFKSGIFTFPTVTGERPATLLACLILGYTVLSVPVPVFLDWLGAPFLFSWLGLIPLAALAVRKAFRKEYRAAQKLVKIMMLCGIVFLILARL